MNTNQQPVLAGNTYEQNNTMDKQLNRLIQDTDLPGLQRFIFKAVAMQVEKPELADLMPPEQVADVIQLYDLLFEAQKLKNG